MAQHQVYPLSPDDLLCMTCPNRYPTVGDLAKTQERARVARWHIYAGPSETGAIIYRVYCPGCWKTGQPAPPNRNTVMEGQLDLLEGVVDELRGRGNEVPGRSKRSGKSGFVA